MTGEKATRNVENRLRQLQADEPPMSTPGRMVRLAPDPVLTGLGTVPVTPTAPVANTATQPLPEVPSIDSHWITRRTSVVQVTMRLTPAEAERRERLLTDAAKRAKRRVSESEILVDALRLLPREPAALAAVFKAGLTDRVGSSEAVHHTGPRLTIEVAEWLDLAIAALEAQGLRASRPTIALLALRVRFGLVTMPVPERERDGSDDDSTTA